MADSTRSSIVVDAPPAEVLDIIADLEAYPEWAKEITSVEILAEDGDGGDPTPGRTDGRRDAGEERR